MNYKSLSQQELNFIFEDESFKTSPMHHQLVSLAFGMDKQRVYFCHGIGTGKTVTALYMNQLWNTKKTLIVCPNCVVNTWKEQIEEHTIESYTVLEGVRDKRQELIHDNSRFHILNYEGLLSIFGTNEPPIINKFGKKKKQRAYSIDMVNKIDYDSIIFDEIHNLKSYDAKQTEISWAISNKVKYVVGMTGTPIAKDEEDLWGQYYCLDLGESLGSSYYSFINKYFYKYTKWEKRIKPSMREVLLDKLKPSTIRFTREECVDLPEKVYQKYEVDMTKEQTLMIQNIINKVELETLNTENIQNLANKFSQVAGGFIFDDNHEPIYIKSNKIKELQRLLKQIKSPVIVFHAYQPEGVMIEKLCKKMKISYASMRGEIKDINAQEDKFKHDDKCMVLIAHLKSAGTGKNLQDKSSTMIFYSNEYSSLEREQGEGRIWRKGQENKCLYIDLICKKSMDERRLEIIEGKKELSKIVLDYIEQFKGSI